MDNSFPCIWMINDSPFKPKKAHLKICSSWETPYFRPEISAPYPQISAPGFFGIPVKSELFPQVCVIFMHEQFTRFVWITHALVRIPYFLVWTIHFLVWITNFLLSIPHFLIWKTHSLVWNMLWITRFLVSKTHVFVFEKVVGSHVLFLCTNNSYE